MGEAKRRVPASQQQAVKCSRAACDRTSRNPKAAGWGYMYSVGPGLPPHWVGWWCKPCLKGLHKAMIAEGAELTVGKLQ